MGRKINPTENFFRAHKSNETLKKYYEQIGISSGKFFTRDTFYLVPYKGNKNKRRFSEEEQQEELEYHILKAIKLFTARIQFG